METDFERKQNTKDCGGGGGGRGKMKERLNRNVDCNKCGDT